MRKIVTDSAFLTNQRMFKGDWITLLKRNLNFLKTDWKEEEELLPLKVSARQQCKLIINE